MGARGANAAGAGAEEQAAPSKRPTATSRERVRRELKTPGDGTRETDQGPEGDTEKKTRTFQEQALLETSERQTLRIWERE